MPKSPLATFPAWPVGLILAASGVGSVPASAEVLLRFDFNEAGSWPGVPTKAVGTVDAVDSAQPSGALVLTGVDGKAGLLVSGPLAVKNAEAELGKLTLSFDHAISVHRPFIVRVESFDADRQRTGGLETTVYPAAVNFLQRAALELSAMKPEGGGTFSPTAPFLQISFGLAGAAELRIDNVALVTPAFYVSPEGSDASDGRSEKTALASPQRALDRAQPGDIVVLMNGSYGKVGANANVARFPRPGTPAGWITLKNYPGHQPVLSAAGQTAVSIRWGQKGTPEEGQNLGYLEVRGLRIRGDGDKAREKYPDELGQQTANTNAQGIEVNGRKTPYPGARTPGEYVHHIRLADNVVEYCSADGIYIEYCDWLYVEGNAIRNNCWATAGFAPAGFAVMGYANFDTADNVPKMLIANNQVSGNKLTVKNQPWGKPVKTTFFNGNGILLDANAEKPPAVYLGRTLVQNNLVFNNGGGGIQMWANHRMDLVNNTVYFNGALPEMKWGQIGFERCRDVRLINNIVVAQPDRPLDTWYVNRADKDTGDIVRMNNLYWGGVKPPIAGEGDVIADPLFVNPTDDPANADFRLKPESPALQSGVRQRDVPLTDLANQPRPLDRAPDRGALQKLPTNP